MAVDMMDNKVVKFTFNNKYLVEVGTNDFIKQQSQKIRHDVFCEEFGFEPTNDDGLEKDSFDEIAIHAIIKDIEKDTYIGTSRVIPYTEDKQLPFMKVYKQSKHINFINNMDNSGEFSRLSILKNYRVGDLKCHPVACMIYALCHYSFNNSINSLYYIVEKRLGVMVDMIGVVQSIVSDDINYKGNRVLYISPIEKTIESLNKKLTITIK